MAEVPNELKSQIEIFEGIIKSLNDIIDVNKVPVQYYGADFIPQLTDIRQKALDLRNAVEIFKTSLEFSIGAQYAKKNNRFASTKKVIKTYLGKTEE